MDLTIKLNVFNTKKKEEIDIPVNKIISVYECPPLRLSDKCIPLSRLLISEELAERSHFVTDTLRNIKAKIKNSFEEYIKSGECDTDALMTLSLDDLPIFDIVDDINQHALVMIPINRIDTYKNSHKERCIVSICGHEYYIDKSRSGLTDDKIKLESELIQVMKNCNLI